MLYIKTASGVLRVAQGSELLNQPHELTNFKEWAESQSADVRLSDFVHLSDFTEEEKEMWAEIKAEYPAGYLEGLAALRNGEIGTPPEGGKPVLPEEFGTLKAEKPKRASRRKA